MLSGLQHAFGERSGPLAFHSDMNGMLGAISNSISILFYSSTQEAGGSPAEVAMVVQVGHHMLG